MSGNSASAIKRTMNYIIAIALIIAYNTIDLITNGLNKLHRIISNALYDLTLSKNFDKLPLHLQRLSRLTVFGED